MYGSNCFEGMMRTGLYPMASTGCLWYNLTMLLYDMHLGASAKKLVFSLVYYQGEFDEIIVSCMINVL